jgi:glycosyltransferase involved in cell wall biosynthesis
VNWHAFDQLAKRFDARYAGPIVPHPNWAESTISKVQRKVLGRPGHFAYFSESTLDANARQAEKLISGDTDAVVFRSSARWCRTRLNVPYFVYLDAVFQTFFENTVSLADFHLFDLERIWREEAEFLEGASGVFFESAWGMQKAIESYSLKKQHYFPVGRGGVIDPPSDDMWNGGAQLLTMSMNFRQKGGDLVFEAYRKLKPQFPMLTWRVVGAPPEGNWQQVAGISYEGSLNPDVPEERARLENIIASSFLLLHPTREDVNPLVITETAYFGCPAISVRRFAMPELVIDGVTGILLDPDTVSESLPHAIASLLHHNADYRRMRKSARDYALRRCTWDRIGDAIATKIEQCIL